MFQQVKSIVILFAIPVVVVAQDCPSKNCVPELLSKRSLEAFPLGAERITIDGVLSEASWSQAPVAARFSQSRPDAGAESRLQTEARVLYGGDAVYIGLRMYERPDDIVAPVVRRDDETSCDWVFVEFDSRHDSRSGFSFGLNPTGVQVDGAWKNDTLYDASWDGIWEGATKIDAQGWTAEYRIPFSQLPYRNVSGRSTWGANFYRFSLKLNEASNWSPRDALHAGVVSRFNDLILETPANPSRAEVTPFTVAQASGQETGNGSFRGGADVKLGLGSAFQMSAAVLPDFGQVEADPDQLNLTAFELFQQERRPFFVQGTDAFSFDTSLKFTSRGNSFAEETPFYSRRIGRQPRGILPADATVLDVPAASTILAALKISGQTSGLWSLGGFAAATEKETASLLNADHNPFTLPVEPGSVKGLFRISKSSPENTYSFGMLFSNETHFNGESGLFPSLADSAMSLGFDGRRRLKSNEYELAGWFVATRLSGQPDAIRNIAEAPHHYFQRPDDYRLDSLGHQLTGTAAQGRFSRIAGNLQWNLNLEMISPGFDVNEIGFQRNSDWLLIAGTWQYEAFRSGRFIRHWIVGSDSLGLGWNWSGESRARTAGAFLTLDTNSYWTTTATLIHDFEALSTDWLRGGPGLLLPPRDSLRYTIITDQRKTTFAQLDGSFTRETGTGSHSWMINPQVYFWSGTHFRWSLGLSYQEDTVGWQYVSQNGAGGAYLVARDLQKTLSPVFRADWAISPHLIIQMYTQPFVSSGAFDRYQHLIDPRASAADDRFEALQDSQIIRDSASGNYYADLNRDGLPDSIFATPDNTNRSSNASVIFRWEYRPGSFVTAAWNHRSDVTLPRARQNLIRDLRDFFSDPASDTFLIKISYHLFL